ncbi:MAG TPA: hypothetical protein VF799_05320 [Geobacteraceae bacterium]
MQTRDGNIMLPVGFPAIPGVIFFAWTVAGYLSDRSFPESCLLLGSQSLLAILMAALLTRTVPGYRSAEGPSLAFIFCLHGLIYYSASNIIPALLPELRPEELTVRVPGSPVWAYCVATIAAGFMVLGVCTGSRLACRNSGQSGGKMDPHGWLPDYRLAMLACLSLLVLTTAGTFQYGVQVAMEVLSPEDLATMTLGQQLFFHGLFSVLPVAPFLAAAAFVKGNSSGQRRWAAWLLVVASVLTLAMLLIWGQRSTAILALALPLGLLANAGKLCWSRMVLPAIGVMVVVYGSVTIVRDSNLVPLLMTTDPGQLTVSEVVSALETPRADDRSLEAHALTDLSYRTSGLEGVASLVHQQFEGGIPFQWGTTVLSGFLQALPVPLRPEPDMAARIKTAPARLGIFEPGDWVTTILAEFVLDFGPVLLFLPALLAGMFLTVVDRSLLRLGQRPALGGLLILRIIFFLFIISNGGSLAEMTIMLFKATIAYTALFLVLGGLIQYVGLHKRPVDGAVPPFRTGRSIDLPGCFTRIRARGDECG